MTTALTISQPATTELYRQATDVAGVCREIVLKTAMEIQRRKYVKVEGWQSIATAHGCTASARDVERIEGGVRAIGEIRRMSDGVVIATAEGFVGEDEPTWFGGGPKSLPKRPDYAIRAMCQTRAISRACRTAFAHVVVLIDSNLSTTPAEEVPDGGFNDTHATPAPKPVAAPVRHAEPVNVTPAAAPITVPRDADAGDKYWWKAVVVPPFIKKHAGKTLGDLPVTDITWWAKNYEPRPYKGEIQQKDVDFKEALMAGAAAYTFPDDTKAEASRTAAAAQDSEDVPF
jgi:hypothetical protein